MKTFKFVGKVNGPKAPLNNQHDQKVSKYVAESGTHPIRSVFCLGVTHPIHSASLSYGHGYVPVPLSLFVNIGHPVKQVHLGT